MLLAVLFLIMAYLCSVVFNLRAEVWRLHVRLEHQQERYAYLRTRYHELERTKLLADAMEYAHVRLSHLDGGDVP